MRVLRIYHQGGIAAHRARERALAEAGADLTLVIPSRWPGVPNAPLDARDTFRIIELPVSREGDVNRHAYRSRTAVKRLMTQLAPDVVDIHEEPFSVAGHQWLGAAPPGVPIVMYTAQNIDKRFPPPFARHEDAAHRRAAALYPCSSQAASVARGKGFAGVIQVIPLGYDEAIFTPGSQSLEANELLVVIAGRLVPEKGITDAVEILARLNAARPTRLVVVGSGPEETIARQRARAFGVADRLELVPWQSTSELAAMYREAHLVLIPSHPTETWTEQFGRVIIEAQASGAVVSGYASGAIPEVVGAAGVLTNVRVPTILAERLTELVADASAYESLRQQGFRQSKTRTWTSVACEQFDLYRRVIAESPPRLALPRSPKARREAARAEYGPTAATVGGLRPFALPVLRQGGRVASGLAWLIDSTREIAARIQGGR